MYSVGIVTLTGVGNFGNRLQNFALQEAIKSVGVDRVETIRSNPRTREGGNHFVRRLSILRSEGAGVVLLWLRSRFGHLVGVRPPVSTHFLGPERESAIREFVAESIDESSFDCSSVESAASIASSFDAFVVGSDQVWHPGFGLRDSLRFLGFANPDQRIAYAASFGVSSIPRHLEDVYRSGITSMAYISVREYRAAEIVRELTGREVPVVLDPTMLLESAVWEPLAKVPESLAGGGYVAEFFLGSPTDNEMLPILEFATDRGFDRVDLKSDAREDLAAMGPLEFIGAIKASNLLVTDSFHAAVFATIFRVPYLLKGRGAMNSRFDTLLSKSGLPMPRWGTFKELEASIDIDWDSVHQRIARERADSLDYLRTALSLPTGA